MEIMPEALPETEPFQESLSFSLSSSPPPPSQMQSKWTYGSSPSWEGGSLPRKVSDCMTNHVLGRETLAPSRGFEACASLPPDNGFIRLEGGPKAPPAQHHWPLLLNFPIVCPFLVLTLHTIWFSWRLKKNKYRGKDPRCLNWECSKPHTQFRSANTLLLHRSGVT